MIWVRISTAASASRDFLWSMVDRVILGRDEIYKALEHKHTATSDALGSEQAQEVIRRCIEQYEIHFCGKVEPVLEP